MEQGPPTRTGDTVVGPQHRLPVEEVWPHHIPAELQSSLSLNGLPVSEYGIVDLRAEPAAEVWRRDLWLVVTVPLGNPNIKVHETTLARIEAHLTGRSAMVGSDDGVVRCIFAVANSKPDILAAAKVFGETVANYLQLGSRDGVGVEVLDMKSAADQAQVRRLTGV